MAIELSTKTPVDVLTGNELALLRDPTEATPDARMKLASVNLLKVAVINDLSTGGTAVALSAEMGKTLLAMIEDLASQIANGGSPSPGLAPALPASFSFGVPNDYEVGALVAFATPDNVPSPPPTWTMTSAAGLAIEDYTGVVYISNLSAFQAAIGAGISFNVTASNAIGSDTAAINLTTAPGLPTHDTIAAANRASWFDMAHNDDLVVTPAGQITSWANRGRPTRVGKNPFYPTLVPSRLGRSNVASQRPSCRFAPASTADRYGLMFEDDPLSLGIYQIAIDNGGKIMAWTNLDIPLLSGQRPPEITVSGGIIGRNLLVAILWDASGFMSIRVNGVSMGAPITVANLGAPSKAGFAMFVMRSNVEGGRTPFAQAGVGNSRYWNQVWDGEICEIISFYNTINQE